MTWILDDQTLPSSELLEKNGNRFLSANGRVGLRGTLDESGAAEKAAVVLNGLYDRVGDKWREPVNAPNPCRITLSVDGHELDAVRRPPLEHRQGIDFRHGIQFRETRFRLSPTSSLKLKSERFVSLVDHDLIALRFEFQCDAAAEVSVRIGIDGEVWDINGPHLENFSSERKKNLLYLGARTQEKQVPVAVASCLLVPQKAVARTAEKSPKAGLGQSRSIYETFNLKAAAGEIYVFHVFGLVSWGENAGPAELSRRGAAIAAEGYEAVRARHVEAWDRRWDDSDVVINGDEEAQMALRFSIYHLLAIAPPADSDALSIPARGLSGQVYKGGVFWDTEMFMLPFFLSTQPSLAKALIEYRIRTLAGARKKALQYGYKGAFYAWESQEGGEDACTLFNVNDVFTGRPMRTFFRDKQIHISADMVFALGAYVESSGDELIIRDGGAEMAYECVRFLVDWMYYKPGKNRYEVLDVTGPDEYHERVNNDFFTNAIIRKAIESCLRLDSLFAARFPVERAALIAKLDMAKELTDLPGVLAKFYVPKPSIGEPKGVIEQFDGYFELEDPSLKELLGRKLHEHEYLGGGNGLARWTRVIKQADVVLALAIMPEDFSVETVEKNWDYYEPRTEHGSSLSASAYSLTASRIGKTEPAYRYFLKTARIDIDGSGKQYVGDLYIGGTHPAANGGAWMATVQGFCGLRVRDGEVEINPALPESWKSVSFVFHAQGRRIKAKIEATGKPGAKSGSCRTELRLCAGPSSATVNAPQASAASENTVQVHSAAQSIRVVSAGLSREWNGRGALIIEG